MVLEQDEGAAIAAALGSKKAAILQNHGLLVACGSVEAMLHFFIAFESACRVQILADTTAAAHRTETLKINHDEARKTGGMVGSQGAGWLSGTMEFEVLEKEEGVNFHSTAV